MTNRKAEFQGKVALVGQACPLGLVRPELWARAPSSSGWPGPRQTAAWAQLGQARVDVAVVTS
eukprot:261993-Chlamydomonas_euryale.AAC.2